MDFPLFDVFISYAHEDIEWARWLHNSLTRRGLVVFFDEAVLRFGDNVPASIERGLEHSIAVLLVLSHQSKDKGWLTFESSFDWTATFIDQKRTLVPVIVDEGYEVPPRLKNLRSCTLTQKDDTTVEKLVDDLLARGDLKIGPYHLERHRIEPIPAELFARIAQCVGRYMHPTAERLRLFETAMTELIDNAFRHAREGRVSLTVHATRRFVEVTVHDAGRGYDLRDTLVSSGRLLDSDPMVMGRRGLRLLEAQGVRLTNGHGDDRQHWVKAVIWWSIPPLVSNSRVAVYARGNGCLTVEISGRLDHGTTPAIEAALLGHVHHPRTNGLVLDMQHLEYVSSNGLRLLMTLALVARVNGYKVAVAALQPIVAEIFEVSRFNVVFSIFGSLEAAEAAIFQDHSPR